MPKKGTILGNHNKQCYLYYYYSKKILWVRWDKAN